jgi:hypothetical protein
LLAASFKAQKEVLPERTHLPIILTKSPQASGPIRHIVPGLLLGVGEPGQHSGSGFPGNSAVSGQVPHGVTSFFEFAQNLGNQR